MRLTLLLLLFVSTGYSNDKIRQRAAEAENFTARILVKNGDPFSSGVREGHGSGFIVNITDATATLFTNRHVIAKNPWEAQHIQVEFHTLGHEHVERAPAKLKYKSPLLDFAVLELDLTPFSEPLRKRLAPAQVAVPTEYANLSRPGSSVIAVGNPLDTQSVVTTGIISNVHTMAWEGIFLQTSAAINPGNSGGPLIDLETGKVLGINTLKQMEAEAMGFSLPIIDAMEEWGFLKNSPSYQEKVFLPFVLRPVSMEQIEAAGLLAPFEQKFPNAKMKQRWKHLHYVLSASSDSNLQPHDIVMTADGQFVGGHPFILRKLAQRSKKEVMSLEVFRKDRFVTVDCPIKTKMSKDNFQFVMIGGALFTNMDSFQSIMTVGRESAVVLVGGFPGTVAPAILREEMGAVLSGVEYEGKFSEVNDIGDLKTFIASIPEGKNRRLKLHFLAGMQANVGFAQIQIPGFDSRRTVPKVLPLEYVLSDENVDMSTVLREFDFVGFDRPHTRMGLLGLWNHYCAANVASNGK